MKTNDILKHFLTEESFTNYEFERLNESTKTESVKELATTILASLKDKVEQFDTTPIDRSRGDIKRLKELKQLQDSINMLEAIVERSQGTVSPDLQRYLKEIVRAIMNLNKYSNDFKEAYRDRKTLLVLKYQSIVMSIISATSYLISVMVDLSSGNVEAKENPRYEEISPLKTVMAFNKSVELGDFRMTLKKATQMREYFVEVELDAMELLEAGDIISTVVDGISGIIGNDKRFTEYLYKASGIVTLIMSMREILFMMHRSRTKLNDMMKSIGDFSQLTTSTSTLARLNKYAQRFVVDAEESSKLAKRDIEAQNKEIVSEIRSIPKRTEAPAEVEAEVTDFDIGF